MPFFQALVIFISPIFFCSSCKRKKYEQDGQNCKYLHLNSAYIMLLNNKKMHTNLDNFDKWGGSEIRGNTDKFFISISHHSPVLSF